ncbi:MAG: ASKHA domain-containing protein, partial [Tissierellia bacterium]|nr:ASKHA domain-containing protein [Tissierellia bacterium]
TTIGNVKPIGICGSGLIDIVGAFVNRGILMKSGRWSKNLNSKLSDRIKDKKFYITEDIYISQKDIRQIQLAKGAIAAGLILMLEEIGMKIDEISMVYIAGAFGYHINPDNIKIIGLIPKGFNGEIRFLGNTSLEGARLALINKRFFEEVNDIMRKMEVLELSLRENFQGVFVSQLNF